LIGIINYGLGNLKAFENLFKSNSIPCLIIENEKDFDKVKCLILPGVGAFDNAITKLKSQSYFIKLNNLICKHQIPIMGICIGMHIMLEESEEGNEKGLSWVKGNVKKFKESNLMLPHMGWNDIEILNNDEIFVDIDDYNEFYFLHSYYVENIETQNILTNTIYKRKFCSAFKHKNIYGIQFHPEKSHSNGVKILKNFYKKYA